MNLRRTITTLGVVGALAGCDLPAPTAPDAVDESEVTLTDLNESRVRRDQARGRGLLDFGGGLMVEFDFRSIQKRSSLGARGHLRFEVVLGGELVEFRGRVTCMAVDETEGRAWIGGVVTRNNSTHPSFTTPVHEVGKDIWFRVLDTGKGSDEPDRSTFVGFEGGGGIITSEEYCQSQIWPDDNARTQPQSQGKIVVKG